ncbi:DUF2382 domain-containing protein [Salinicoccus sediminis]|uniref:DUF2382 domain-containing protein n=1 Tax=Salinicoccus sediminis TaxID=1432562 RepID=UPI00069A9EBD|nr:DUF2382 domain-containing protein [Salinicoccus sediminis]
MRNIETFTNEEELNGRIEQLKAEGVNEDDITVVSREELAGSAVGYTGVNFRTSEGNAWDKIVSWFSDENPEDRVMTELDVDSREEGEYKEALDRGEILLHVKNSSESGTGVYPERGTGIYPEDEKSENMDAERGTGVYAEDDALEDDEELHTTRDNRTVGKGEAAEGQREQNVMDTHRDDPLGDKEGDYSVDERALNTSGGLAGSTDEGYDYDENEIRDREIGDSEREDLSEEERLQLREEHLNVDKENVQTGEVNVGKHVETDHQEFDVPVEREEVSVERRPVEDDARPGSIDDTGSDDSVHIPVSEERVNVEKENVVNEEVVVKKDKVRDTEHVSEDVRREEADINETDNQDRETRNRDTEGNINDEDRNFPGNDDYRR